MSGRRLRGDSQIRMAYPSTMTRAVILPATERFGFVLFKIIIKLNVLPYERFNYEEVVSLTSIEITYSLSSVTEPMCPNQEKTSDENTP